MLEELEKLSPGDIIKIGKILNVASMWKVSHADLELELIDVVKWAGHQYLIGLAPKTGSYPGGNYFDIRSSDKYQEVLDQWMTRGKWGFKHLSLSQALQHCILFVRINYY